MLKVSDMAKGLIRNCIFASILFFIVFAIISFENIVMFSIGLILGLGFTIFKIILLEKNIEKAVELNSAGADNYMKLHFLFRYLLTIVVFLVGAMISSQALIGCILGVMSLQISAYTVNLPIFNKKNKN